MFLTYRVEGVRPLSFMKFTHYFFMADCCFKTRKWQFFSLNYTMHIHPLCRQRECSHALNYHKIVHSSVELELELKLELDVVDRNILLQLSNPGVCAATL